MHTRCKGNVVDAILTLPGTIVGGILVDFLGLLPGMAATFVLIFAAWYWVETVYLRK